MSPETDSRGIMLSQTHVLRRPHGAHVMFGGSINRTQQTVRGACLAGRTQLPTLADLSSTLIFDMWRETQQRTSGVSDSLLLTHADSAEAWLLQPSLLLSQLY